MVILQQSERPAGSNRNGPPSASHHIGNIRNSIRNLERNPNQTHRSHRTPNDHCHLENGGLHGAGNNSHRSHSESRHDLCDDLNSCLRNQDLRDRVNDRRVVRIMRLHGGAEVDEPVNHQLEEIQRQLKELRHNNNPRNKVGRNLL